MNGPADIYDIAIIGGGINGAGIARDAAGRGLRVLLIEQDDLAAHTSSASTKLIHGGLRYLEYYALRLVREALQERERLLGIARSIARPLTFVLPIGEGSRPAWMLRAGLFLYDRLGGRGSLPRSRPVRLAPDGFGAGLQPGLTRGFAYADGWVDDARLVVLNALDAQERGAAIRTRTRLRSATAEGDHWRLTLDTPEEGEDSAQARVLINAAGPWVNDIFARAARRAPARPARLVKGSHIIVPRIHDRDHAYILQNPDGRIVFAIPYEGRFTLIGTTDLEWQGDPAAPAITPAESDYLCAAANAWLARPIAPADVVHSYAGIRALYDDGAREARSITRDYVLALDAEGGPPMLSIFGGKITTYRQLAEKALRKLAPHLPPMRAAWTASAPLPGADIEDAAVFINEVCQRWPWLPAAMAERMARAYGTRIARIIGGATRLADLGRDHGGITDAELAYLRDTEWAQTAEDVLWRRSKLGLHLPAEAIPAITAVMEAPRADA